jgi:hypothetical protein
VELSSESDPEDIDLDQINDIHVSENDIDELDRLISTTKNQYCNIPLIQSPVKRLRAQQRDRQQTCS